MINIVVPKLCHLELKKHFSQTRAVHAGIRNKLLMCVIIQGFIFNSEHFVV